MRIIHYVLLILMISLGFTLTACKGKDADNVIKVGVISGPDTETWEVAKKIAKERYGLELKLIEFSDYTLPNEALNNGEIDANAFQHKPFLDEQIKSRGYDIVPVAKTFVYPIALYSKKITRLNQMKVGDKIAIPNDPSNEARALLVLAKGGLITLKEGVGVNATIVDIVKNPKNLNIIELSAAQLPRVLQDVTAAVINNDYAGPAGLNPQDALLVEDADSPYMNIIVVRTQDKNKKTIHQLVQAFQTPEVKAVSEKISHGNAVAGW